MRLCSNAAALHFHCCANGNNVFPFVTFIAKAAVATLQSSMSDTQSSKAEQISARLTEAGSGCHQRTPARQPVGMNEILVFTYLTYLEHDHESHTVRQ